MVGVLKGGLILLCHTGEGILLRAIRQINDSCTADINDELASLMALWTSLDS